VVMWPELIRRDTA